MGKRSVPPRGAVVLSPSSDIDEFTALDLMVGLRGVCQALDASVGTGADDADMVQRPSIAANVLSSIVMERMGNWRPNVGGRGVAGFPSNREPVYGVRLARCRCIAKADRFNTAATRTGPLRRK
jgi:hypothetical protein